jgi:general stress protein 26
MEENMTRRLLVGQALTTIVLTMGAASAQTAAPAASRAARSAPDREAVVAVARAIMEKARYATLVTIGDAGHPQARVMDPFPPERDLGIWMATNGASRKVAQIEADPRVTLVYFDAAGGSYVTLLGTARLVRDAAQKASRWKEDWATFYKDRNRGDDYVLIQVTPARIELSDPAHGIDNDPSTWRPVVLELGR